MNILNAIRCGNQEAALNYLSVHIASAISRYIAGYRKKDAWARQKSITG